MYRRAISAMACALAFAAIGSSPALAINTYKAWNGTDYVYPFGCDDTTTYGQVITVTKKKSTLDKFSFWWANSTTGSMVVRGEVYAWDGEKATGSALWESKPMTISYNDAAFHEQRFKTGALSLTPGVYIMFASVAKDYEKCTAGYQLEWGIVADETYTGGTMFYQNNGGDEGQWTTVAWSNYGADLAFKAALK